MARAADQEPGSQGALSSKGTGPTRRCLLVNSPSLSEEESRPHTSFVSGRWRNWVLRGNGFCRVRGAQDCNTGGLLRRAVQEEPLFQVLRGSPLTGPSLSPWLLVVTQNGQVRSCPFRPGASFAPFL